MAVTRAVAIGCASAVLAELAAPIREVGELLGYSSPEHFSRRFREQFRLIPGQYRKRHRGAEGLPAKTVNRQSGDGRA